MKNISAVFLFIMTIYSSAASGEWFRGNTHTHTCNSDGDAYPEDVVRWYRENGYNFVVITDHNLTTNVDVLNDLYALPNRFLVMSGNEISCSAKGPGNTTLPVHMVAINSKSRIGHENLPTVVETLRANVSNINAAGGIVQVAHPNFHWSFGADELGLVEGYHLLEVRNMHPSVNNYGGEGHPGTEEIWDDLLSRGKRVWGIGCDDAHNYTTFRYNAANPGRCWVWVDCDSLCGDLVSASLKEGKFYFSTGVTLDTVSPGAESYKIIIEQSHDEVYTTEFIGKGGRVLETVSGTTAEYRYRGDEGYVRARVSSSNGFHAWTQPHFTGK